MIQTFYNEQSISIQTLQTSLERIKSIYPSAELCKLDVTGNLGIIVADEQIGYIDLLTGQVEYSDMEDV